MVDIYLLRCSFIVVVVVVVVVVVNQKSVVVVQPERRENNSVLRVRSLRHPCDQMARVKYYKTSTATKRIYGARNARNHRRRRRQTRRNRTPTLNTPAASKTARDLRRVKIQASLRGRQLRTRASLYS